MKFEGKRVAKVAPLSANRAPPLAANQVGPLRRKWNGSMAVQINKYELTSCSSPKLICKYCKVIPFKGISQQSYVY
jgi:hypothetical protein